jgi:acyl-CoA reductase-like NAD-dependent aldehyde dehydrogenase
MSISTEATDHSVVDRVLTELQAGEGVWARTGHAERRDLLRRVAGLVADSAAEWVSIASSIKGLSDSSPLRGEEWISGPWATAGSARALADTLDRMSRDQEPLAGVRFKTAPGGRVAVPALPANTYDKLLLSGFSADVWMLPGLSADEVRSTAGLGSRTPAGTHGISVVLGAGNIFSIAPLDVLHALHADNRVVALKVNPVTEPLLPIFERILAPYVELGVVRVISGGAEVGSALVHDERVSAVHMTGSERTHDAIVWGAGETGEATRRSGTPMLTKPISSELGGVSPVIVVPGRWSKADLRFQAEHVATQRLHNAGANCIAAQVVLVSSDWDQKEQFLGELRAVLAGAPARPTWYPGGEDRVATARESHPDQSVTLGEAGERVLLEGLDLWSADEPAFSTEYFAPVLAVAELPGEGLDFLTAAARAANESLRGTLGANIVIDPRTRGRLGPAFEDAVASLRYGTIGINAWTGVGYLTPHATWGAFPGHTIEDVQSGIGVVHNAFLLEGAERTVVRGPFRPSPRSILHGEWSLSPRPPWFVTNRTAPTTGRRLVSFAARPRLSALPGIFASALRG